MGEKWQFKWYRIGWQGMGCIKNREWIPGMGQVFIGEVTSLLHVRIICLLIICVSSFKFLED